MVVKTQPSDIFKSRAKHIAFAINKEGFNDSGFAGKVSEQYWPELAICGEHEIGTVLSKTVGSTTFHALVCHSLREGWGEDQAAVIQECFDNIPVDDEPIHTIAIGTGLIGIMSGADFRQIVCGMHESKQNIILHAGYSLEAVINCYNEEKDQLHRGRR